MEINRELDCSWRLSSNFCHEKNEIRNKFSSAWNPMRFLNSAINDFESKGHDSMIPSYLFNDFESKRIVLIDAPFCNENEKVPKQLLRKLKDFQKNMILELFKTQRKSDSFSIWRRKIHILHVRSMRESIWRSLF